MSDIKAQWKFEIFLVLLAKAPIMKILDEYEEPQAEIKDVCRQLTAATETIYESLVELQAEKPIG